jgi:choline dehydrogenase
MRVLLLEAGGDDQGYTYEVPAFHGLATEDPSLRWDYFVRHYASDERQKADPKFTPERNGVLYPRAGTLGGCTAHNAMITVYPHNHDWDAIARMTGDSSWNHRSMRRYFERLERCAYVKQHWPRFLQHLLPRAWVNPGRHGFHGWLGTDIARPELALGDAQLVRVILHAAADTLQDDLGRPFNLFEGLATYADPNDWRVQAKNPEGLWFTPLATSGGRRNGTREYLRQVATEDPDRLTLQTNALATRVLLDDSNTAVGVEYLQGEHLYRADPRTDQAGPPSEPRQALASREVILACGTFNTPQLLMLSGIGPRAELASHGIPIRVDLPGVGENLQDRYEVGVVSEMAEDFDLLRACTFDVPPPPTDECFNAWLSGQGPYTTNGVAISIIKRSRPYRPEPDLFIFGLPGYFRGYFPGYSSHTEAKRNSFTWAILKAHTRNTAGRVALRSADPRDVPEINFHYFEEGNDTEGDDLEAVVQGVEFVRRLLERAGGFVKAEVLPGPSVQTHDQIAEFVRQQAWGHHACGTCRIGPRGDPMAVVDSGFRVRGVANLRVVDASVFPRIPGFFIVTSIYMLSEKASDVILADARKAGRRTWPTTST